MKNTDVPTEKCASLCHGAICSGWKAASRCDSIYAVERQPIDLRWCIILLVATANLCAQAPAKTKKVAISFLMPITTESINQLVKLSNDQARNGVKDITILISSPGGDTASAFSGYHLLRGLPAEITTFNVGQVDSAAMILFCAGAHRYSMPGPGTRFLIHGNRTTFNPGNQFTSSDIDVQLSVVKNLNQMIAQVLDSVAPSKMIEIAAAIQSQRILTPEEAKTWGLVDEVKQHFMDSDVTLLAVEGHQPQPAEALVITAGGVSIQPVR